MVTRKAALAASTALTVAFAGIPASAQSESTGASCDDLLQRIEALPQNLPEDVDWSIEDVRAVAEGGEEDRCAIVVSEVDRVIEEGGQDSASDTATAEADAEASDTDEAQVVEQAQTTVTLEDQAVVEGIVRLDRQAPSVDVEEGETEIMVTPGKPSVNVTEQAAQITIREQPATITVEMQQPTIRIEQAPPEIIITMPEPGVDVANSEPQIEVRQSEPRVTVTQSAPTVNLELQVAEDGENSQGVQVEDSRSGERYAMGETREMPAEEAEVRINRGEPIVRFEAGSGDSEADVSISRADPQISYERAEPQVQFSQAGEPMVEYAQAGEPTVTIRQSGEEGESQQASASGDTSGSQDSTEMAQSGETAEGEATETAQSDAEGTEDGEATEMAQADAQSTETEAMEADGTETAESGEGLEGDEVRMTEGDTTEMAASDTEGSEPQQPAFEVAGYQPQSIDTLSTEELTGTPLYSVNDELIGEVSQALLAESGDKIDRLVLDVGGFLGLGEHSVAVGFDKLQIMRGESAGDVRVYVQATEEELEAMPEWRE